MNKIIADKEEYLSIENQNINLDIKNNNLHLDIKGDVIINDLSNNDDLNLTININSNAQVIYNKFTVLKNNNFMIEIHCNDNSKIEFNYSSLILGDVKGNINTIVNGSNIESSIRYKAVTQEAGKIHLVSDVSVKKGQEDNEFLESLHVLMLSENENILEPNLNIESDKIIANHEATMGSVDGTYLHYLQSKGINEEMALILIKEGFLISNLKCDEKEITRIKEILINRR